MLIEKKHKQNNFNQIAIVVAASVIDAQIWWRIADLFRGICYFYGQNCTKTTLYILDVRRGNLVNATSPRGPHHTR